MARFLRIVPLLFLSCLTAYSQTGISVYDRLQEQREAFPLERVYVHTDAEDYLQGDRIWLKAYLMDEVDHTPVDSTLYVYAELFDKNGKMARQVKLLRREGAFYGYLDIPEDLLSGAAYLRAYTRYMAAAPETAFIKRIVVGRDPVREPVPDRTDGSLSVRRRRGSTATPTSPSRPASWRAADIRACMSCCRRSPASSSGMVCRICAQMRPFMVTARLPSPWTDSS